MGENARGGNRSRTEERCKSFERAFTVTRAVWDEDNNLVEMTYCAVTGGVLSKKVTKRMR